MNIEAMKLALDALESRCGTNADERLPGGAIPALRAALSQQPATPEPVGEPFGWWFTEDPDVFCMPGSGFRRFPNKPEHTVECLALYTHPAPSVPDEKPLPDLMMALYHEAIGWNAYRAAMLAAKASDD